MSPGAMRYTRVEADDAEHVHVHEKTQASVHSQCCVCGKAHPTGLQLHFVPEGPGRVSTSFLGGPLREGYPGLVHGGIISTLVDGAMTNCLFSLGIRAVTAELTVRYLKGVRADRDAKVTAWRLRTRGRVHAVQAEIKQDNRVVVRAYAKFMDRPRPRKAAGAGPAMPEVPPGTTEQEREDP